MTKNSYIIGIDLGTTNCTVAYMKPDSEAIEQFLIPQLIGPAEQGEFPSLPSFVYFPLEEELAKSCAAIAWDPDRAISVGEYAKLRGAEIPARQVASAKSWLCHSGINRREKLLPLNSEEVKISPLQACTELLKHIHEAWNHKFPQISFKEQQIYITVPASFDPSARQLVQEAANQAGYPEIILLEEPQAAFYAWLHKHAQDWRNQLQVGDTILVVDIGGGTTDFSLIGVEDDKGSLGLTRIAVGAHLLLGGDNIDLCLAYLAKNKLEAKGQSIDDWQLQSLTHACRSAKEKLLSAKPPKSVDVTVMGRGSKLIGGALKTSLTLEEIQSLIIDGFFPMVGPQDQSPSEKRLGIQQVGLPFAADPKVSCQLAKFLSQTGETDSKSLNQFMIPTAVLFNGGSLKAEAFRKRLVDLLNSWAKDFGKKDIIELDGCDFDFAVSRGAVSYGQARAGKAIRIKSGTSRSYFIGVEDSMPAIPGMPIPLKAVCIAPFGMEEGTEQFLDKQEFALVLGLPTSFRFFSCSTPTLSNGEIPVVGTLVRRWQTDLSELHPIEANMEKKEEDGKTICVKLQSKVTELGVLELWCVAIDGRKWKLEFDIRSPAQALS